MSSEWMQEFDVLRRGDVTGFEAVGASFEFGDHRCEFDYFRSGSEDGEYALHAISLRSIASKIPSRVFSAAHTAW